MNQKKISQKEHELIFMEKALGLARQAQKQGEVPVGAVLVKNQSIVATGWNQKEQKQKASAHAEMIAIEKACEKLFTWRLCDCELYVTLEPCLMCAGAILSARIKRVIYACKDPKAGAVTSLYQVLQDKRLHHFVEISEGILAEQSSALLTEFFRQKRLSPKI